MVVFDPYNEWRGLLGNQIRNIWSQAVMSINWLSIGGFLAHAKFSNCNWYSIPKQEKKEKISSTIHQNTTKQNINLR